MEEKEIRALARLIDRLDYYKLLRVEYEASLPAIRSAYQSMRRRYHPDLFRAYGPDVVAAVDRISKRVNEAYLTLRDASRRQAYDQGLLGGQLRFDPTSAASEARRPEGVAALAATANGRKFVSQAEEHLRAGDVAKAISSLQMVLTFEPRNAGLKARLDTLRESVRAKKDAERAARLAARKGS